MVANVMNSVVQTGVKSAGWKKKITHFPLKSTGKWIIPWVVSASKLGAFSPMSGNRIGCSSDPRADDRLHAATLEGRHGLALIVSVAPSTAAAVTAPTQRS